MNHQHVEEAPNSPDVLPDTMEQAETEAISDAPAKRMVIGIYIGLVVLGVATGFVLSRSAKTVITAQKPGTVLTGKVAGISDTKTFKDSAEGTIEKGGLNGEGTHKLIRDGGPSQTVYLISSAVDLDGYIGKKVKVWGQTMAAKKAAWLMDVGKIELQ